MILPGVIVNTGPWSKVSTGEKNHLKKQLAKLALLGKPISGTYFRKLDDNVTIIFNDKEMEESCASVNWGILYPLDFVFEDSDNLVPPTFVIIPDIDYTDYLDTIFDSQVEIYAVYQGKFFFRGKAADDRHIVMFPLFDRKGD